MNSTHITGLFQRTWRPVTILTAGILLGACATTATSPDNSLTEAREAISIAQESGARQYAPAELDDAQQHLSKAEAAIKEEQMTIAERSAARAKVTAELATARTEATKATNVNKEMEKAANALREEMGRTGEQQ